MGLLSRATALIKARFSRAITELEDPGESLDYSYERQLELLQSAKRGIVAIVAARRTTETQATRLRENVNKLENQARQALRVGREDLARLALERKEAVLWQIASLDSQIAELAQEQDRLVHTEQRLRVRVESFRTRKEAIKAQYSAADAQVRVGEALTGLSREMSDISLALERAEEKTQSLRARASAIDELIDNGTLNNSSSTNRPDPLDRELVQITIEHNIEEELASLKKQLAQANHKQLSEGSASEES